MPPTDMDMNAAIKEAYAYADPDITYYDTLEIGHASLLTPIRVVRSNASLSTPQGAFSPAGFEITPPDTQGSSRGEMTITVSFLPKASQSALLAASRTRDPITIKYRQYIGAGQDPSAELPMPLQVSSLTMTRNSIAARALLPDLVNMPFPRRLYTIADFPGGQVG